MPDSEEPWKQDPRYEAWRAGRISEMTSNFKANMAAINLKYKLLRSLDDSMYQKDVEALKRNYADYKDSLIRNAKEKINMEKANLEYLRSNLTVTCTEILDPKATKSHNLRTRTCKRTPQTRNQIAALSPEVTDNEAFSPAEGNDNERTGISGNRLVKPDLQGSEILASPVGDLDIALLMTGNHDESKRFSDCASLMGHQIADLYFSSRQSYKRGKAGERGGGNRLRHDSVVSTYNTLLSENQMEYLFVGLKMDDGDATFRRPLSPPLNKRRRNAESQSDNKYNAAISDGNQKYLRVDSTRLYYDKYCFPYQCKVMVINKDSYPVPSTLVMIDKDQVLFRRQTDSGQIRVTLETLRNGRIQLEPV